MATPTEIAYNRAALIESLEITFLMDEVGKHLSEAICGFGIVLNLLLIYVICHRTPVHMKSYAVLLFNFAIFDLLTCVASLFACQKTIFSGLSLTYIFHGPCKYVAPWLCYFCHCFVCHAMAHSQWVLLISFIYRYRVLVDEVPGVKKMTMIVSAFYSMSFVVFLFYYLDIGDSDELKQIMYDLHPQYHYEDTSIWGNLTVSGNTTILTIPSMTAIVYMTFTCVPIYFFIHWCRNKTLSCLASSACSMSETTKASHKKLIMALSIQATIPLFWLLASFIFTLAEFGIISGPIPENMTFRLMDCIPSSSPLVAFIFIAPYREGVLRLISKAGIYKKPTENRVSSTVESQTILVTYHFLGIVLNLLLIYVISHRTPVHMKSYAVLLFNFAIFDLLTCVASLFACQKTIFSGLSLTYIFHGPCKYVAPWLCYFCHCFVCHAMAHSQWILLISFIYRYRVLVDEVPGVKKMTMIVCAFYSMSFVVFLFYYLDIGDSDELKQIMYDLHPQYHYEDTSIWGNLTVSGNTTILTIPSMTAIVYMTFTCVPIYFFIHWCRNKTLSCLASSACSMSETTKASHKKLIMALSIQATIPLFWLLASFIFTLAEFGIISGPIPENMTFRLMDCIPSSSPLVAFIFIAPYREGVLRLISKAGIYKKPTENRVSSTVEKFSQQQPKQPSNQLNAPMVATT